MIESHRNVTGDFNVLTLIIANWHFRCVVQQNVCCLQGWVGEEAGRNKVGFAFGGFVLELSHPAQFSKTHRAFHDPTQLRMFRDMRLDKNRGDIRVEPYGKEHRGKLNGVFTEHTRLVGDGEGMQVDNAMENVIVMLPRDPVAESA